MPWHLTEFLLKGIYLSLLVVLALRGPSWPDVALAGLCMVAGLAFSLAGVAGRKLRTGFHIQGRWFGFFLFLLLENPGRVYAGLIMGLVLGIALPPAFRETASAETVWDQIALTLAPLAGGLALGVLFSYFRQVRQSRVRKWLGLALAVLLMAGAAALFFFEPELLEPKKREMLGFLLLLGMPGFYLLTFASLMEESEVEIAATCGALGAGLWLVLSSIDSIKNFAALALLIPLAIYCFYTWHVLPGLRVFKHALRGLSYARIGEYRMALASLNRALRLNPSHPLAREQMWYVHRQMDVEQLKNDPETLALINYDLCLERSSALLLLDKPRPENLDEAERLLRLIADQRPDLGATCAYWRSVTALHRRKYEDAAIDLLSVLAGERETHAKSGILFQAWQLALILHPEMKVRVAAPLLAQPGRRMDAIAVVERRLAFLETASDTDAWDLKRLLYSDLTEADYEANPPAAPPADSPGDFDYAYVQQLGLALIDNPQRWQRGSEFLRMAARGLPTSAPAIHVQIGKVHEAHGDLDGLRQNLEKAMQLARAVGVASLKAEDQQTLFAAVKQLGDQAMTENRIDEALAAFKFYTQFERAGLETYRTLAELFERKGHELGQRASESEAGGELLKKESQQNVWLALHCAEHALSYDGKDKELLARKDRYYYSIQPDEVKERWESVHLWFDVDYCLDKTRWLLERGDEDLWDWASHLATLASTAQPANMSAKVLRARLCRLRGDAPAGIALLEDIRQHRPEKFASEAEEEAWFVAHRLLGDMYLEENPEQALPCFQEFRKSDKSGADTLFKMGRAFESLGDFTRAAKCFEQVAGFEKHPLFYEARAALERVKRNPVA